MHNIKAPWLPEVGTRFFFVALSQFVPFKQTLRAIAEFSCFFFTHCLAVKLCLEGGSTCLYLTVPLDSCLQIRHFQIFCSIAIQNCLFAISAKVRYTSRKRRECPSLYYAAFFCLFQFDYSTLLFLSVWLKHFFQFDYSILLLVSVWLQHYSDCFNLIT